MTDTSKFTKVYQLKMKNDKIIGDVFVKMKNNELFTDLLVLRKENQVYDTLYQISKSIFRNKNGIDFKFNDNDFCGYKFILKSKDYFEIIYQSNLGIDSDIITVEYDCKERIMKIVKTP